MTRIWRRAIPSAAGWLKEPGRHLVKDRMERTGMRWTVQGAQAILDLRSTYLNGDWTRFWTYFAQMEHERLYDLLTFEKYDTYKAIA